MEDNNPRKALYKSLITSSNPDIRDGIRRFSFNKFDNLLTTNHNFQKDLFLDMKDAGLATGDESHFIATYIAEPKKMGNVVVEEAPSRPVQVPTLLQPAQPSQQGPSLTAVTGQQAVTPMAPEPQFQPFQFDSQREIDQAAKSPVFLANPQAVEAQKGNIIMPTKEAEQSFNQLPADQQRAAIEGGTGFELSQKKANEKRSGLQKLKDFGKALGGMANNAYDAILASEKLLGAKQRDLLTFGGAEENLKKVKKEVLSSMDNIQNQYAQDLRNNNIETSLIDAVNNGELNRLPEAVGYNVANAIVSGLGAAFTGGYSMFAQTLADDYKSGVENLAKETGRTPEQVIADGDDAELIPAVSATIQGLIEKAQLGLASKAIDSKGAYKFIRDLVIKKAGKKSWARAAGAGLGVGVASLESGLQGVSQELTSMASEQASGSDSFDKFYDKLSTAIASEEGSKRLNESLVGEAIGAGGLIGGGRVLNAGLDMISRGPSSGPPTQLGGIATIPANPNDPNFEPDGQPTNTPEQPVVVDTGTENLTKTDQGISGGTVKPQQSQEQIKKRIEDIEGILSNSSAQLQLTGNDPLLKEGRVQLLQELAQLKPLLNAEQLESQVKTEEPKVKTLEQKTSEWDGVMERNDPKEVNDWLLNHSEKGDVFQHEDGSYFVVSDVRTRKNGKKVVEIEIKDPEIEGLIDVHIIEEEDAGSGRSTKFSHSKTPSFKYGYTDNAGNRGIATARYVGNQQSNETTEIEPDGAAVLGETTEATGQTGGGTGTDVPAGDEGGGDQVEPNSKIALNNEAIYSDIGRAIYKKQDGFYYKKDDAEIKFPDQKRAEDAFNNLKKLEDEVVRENINTNVFYHGSPTKGISSFGENPTQRGGGSFGTWFTNDKDSADKFSGYLEKINEPPKKGQVYSAKLDVKSPLIIEWDNFEKEYEALFREITGVSTTKATKEDSIKFRDELKKRGYDAIVFKNVDENDIKNQTYVAVLDNSQIQLEQQSNETPLNPAPIPVAADATGGTTADAGTEPVADESGGSEVEVEPVLAEEVAPAPAEEEVKPTSKTKVVDKAVVKGLLVEANDEYDKAKAAFDKKKAELNKTTREDTPDLFGKRKVEEGPQSLFEIPRISPQQRDKAIQPFRDRLDKAKKEINRLSKLLNEGQEITQKLKFESNEQVQTIGTEVREGKGATKDESVVRKKTPPVRNAGRTPDAIAARNIQFLGDPYYSSLQYVMDMTYHPDLLQSIFGGPDKNAKSGRKSIEGERKPRIQFLDKKSSIKTADRLGELLAEKYAEDNGISVKEAEEKHNFTDIAESIILNHSSRNQIVKAVLDQNDLVEDQHRFQYDPEGIYGEDFNEDAAKDVDNALDNIPDSYWEGMDLTDDQYNELFAPEMGGKESPVEKAKQESTTNVNLQNEKSKGRSEQAGDGGGRSDSRTIKALEGAPSVRGFNGPDPRLVTVAENYAKENGIDLKRQSEYIEVSEERGKRIAQAYEEMKHDPENPKVKEAFQNLIKQTKAQYQALVDAGYKFWFIDDSPNSVEYASSPYNAMRDLRENKEMGVFPTTAGYGSDASELDVADNPMLEKTKFMWPVGGLDGKMKPVLANDLFRAVHDAFGHGLEGAGFRARGEENAWQAHVRLFTGSAIGAITTETRGQNSWLNFGPKGETNRNAKIEDTVFADQKTGLMPEWTWTEGKAADMIDSPFTAFDPPSESMSREQGRKARAALKEAVGPEQFKRMEAIHKNKEKVLEGLQSRKIIEVVCP